MRRVPLILDCDPGHDDAFAILVAAHRAELIAVTAVTGNAPLERTYRNALITLQIAGVDVPVHLGAARPLVGEARHAPYIHGESGLDGPELPPLTREPSAVPAVDAILEAAAAVAGLWLVAVGPLTNVAQALQREPALAQRLAGISVMGGSYGPGNRTPAAEFNIWADPEAAQVVFASGANVVMAGLDLTHQFVIGPERVERIRAVGGPAAAFAGGLLDFFALAYARYFGAAEGGPLHDPCAVLAVTDPHLFESTMRHVAIETGGELTRGMTVVDRRQGAGSLRGAPPNVQVLETIDDVAAFELLVAAVKGPWHTPAPGGAPGKLRSGRPAGRPGGGAAA